MVLDKLTRDLLTQIADLHKIPNGAVSFRKNGKGEVVQSTPNIEIKRKENAEGIDVIVHSSCKGESCHIPVVVTENDFHDMVTNDFYIEDGADVVIVAGCGVHSTKDSGHNGVHFFHIGKNAKVKYVENHLATGRGGNKTLNPVTKIEIDVGGFMLMNTTQIGGVDCSRRKTEAKLNEGARLEVVEKIFTDRFNVARTDFKVLLNEMLDLAGDE